MHFIKHMDKISRSKVLANRVSNFILSGGKIGACDDWSLTMFRHLNIISQQNEKGVSKYLLKDLSIRIFGSRWISDNHHKCYGWNEYLFAFVNCCFRKISIAASVTPSNAVLWFNRTLTLTQVGLIEWKICLH